MRALSSRPDRLVLLLTAAAYVLRLYHLDYQSLWSDEHWSITFAAKSVAEIIQIGMQQEPHPPLYNLVLHFWGQATGNGVFAVRYFSLIFGVVSVPLAYAMGRRLLSPATGLLAAVLMAASPFQVWHSQDARMYTLVTALVLVASIAYLKGLAQPSAVTWGVYVVAIVLGTYAHHFTVLVLVAQGLHFTLVAWRRPGLLKGWLVAQGAILVLYLPWLFSLASLSGETGWLPYTPLPDMVRQLLVTFSAGTAVEASDGWAAGLVFAVLFAYGLLAVCKAQPSRQGVQRVLFVVLGLAVPILAVYALQEVLQKRAFHPRYLLYMMPLFYVTIAAGLERARRLHWSLAAALLAPLVLAGGLGLHNHYFVPKYANADYKGMAAYIAAHAQPGDAIVLSGEAVGRLFGYYYQGTLPQLAILQGEPAEYRLSRFAPAYGRLWFLPYWQTELDASIGGWLAEHAYLARTGWFASARLLLYANPPPGPTATAGVRFGDELALQAYGLWPQQARPGDIAALTLVWQAQRQMGDDYQLSLRLRDAQGHLYWQNDSPPRDGFYPTSRWSLTATVEDHHGLLIPPGTPPGEYSLGLRMYGSAGDLSIADSAGTPVGYELPLVPLRVLRGEAPGADEAGIPHRMTVQAGPQMRLLGHDLEPGPYKDGTTLSVSLYWQATSQPQQDLNATLRVVGQAGRVLVERCGSLLGPDYPTSQWLPGEVVRAFWDLPLPAGSPAGAYAVDLSLGGASWTNLGNIQLAPRLREMRPPSVRFPILARVGSHARLLGYDLPQRAVQPGQALELTLYWQALSTADKSYTVFAHLLDAGGVLQAQQDAIPCQGQCPTNDWLAGEYLRDSYRIPLPEALPPGRYQLEIGMYDAATLQRLPAADAGGTPQPDKRLLLGSVSVSGP